MVCWSDKENACHKTLNCLGAQQLHPSSGCPECWAEGLDTDFPSSPGSAQCPTQAQLEQGAGRARCVPSVSLLQADVGSQPAEKRSQLSLDPGCQSPFPKPCTCHAPPTAPQICREEDRGSHGSGAAVPSQSCSPSGHFVFIIFVSLGPSCLATG